MNKERQGAVNADHEPSETIDGPPKEENTGARTSFREAQTGDSLLQQVSVMLRNMSITVRQTVNKWSEWIAPTEMGTASIGHFAQVETDMEKMPNSEPQSDDNLSERPKPTTSVDSPDVGKNEIKPLSSVARPPLQTERAPQERQAGSNTSNFAVRATPKSRIAAQTNGTSQVSTTRIVPESPLGHKSGAPVSRDKSEPKRKSQTEKRAGNDENRGLIVPSIQREESIGQVHQSFRQIKIETASQPSPEKDEPEVVSVPSAKRRPLLAINATSGLPTMFKKVEHPLYEAILEDSRASKLPEVAPYLRWNERCKIPAGEIAKFLAFAREVDQRYHTEAVVRLLYSRREEKIFVDVPLQEATPTWCSYRPSPIPSDCVEAGNMHSHRSMPAFSSTTDKKNQQRLPGLTVICGRIHDPVPEWEVVYAVDADTRFKLDPRDVIEWPMTIPSAWIDRVTKVEHNNLESRKDEPESSEPGDQTETLISRGSRTRRTR